MSDEKLTDEEVGRCIRERRMMMVGISEQGIAAMLNWWHRPLDICRFDCPQMPANAVVHDVFCDSPAGLMARVLHPSFEPVVNGCWPRILESTGIVMVDGQNEALPSLLEQHDTYDLGNGWSIGCRNPHEWCIYFQGKHLDCWIAAHEGTPQPDSSQLKMYRTAITAVTFWQATRHQYRWLEEQKVAATN